MGNGAVSPTGVRRAYEAFLSGLVPSEDSVRSLVRESWVRSRERGVDPEGVRPQGEEVGEDDFRAYRSAHRLSSVRPLIKSLLLDEGRAANYGAATVSPLALITADNARAGCQPVWR